VKATVDAYDGTVTLYQWDTEDPVLKTFMKAFPGVVKPKGDIAKELESHVRYPEDLFKVQRDVLTRYHVDNPVDFYNGSDRWQIPGDPTQNTTEDQPPYYILAQRPGDEAASFQLTSALNAFQRDNLSAFITASSDPATYGQIRVLRLPGNTPFRGPKQVQQSFNTDDQVAGDLTLFRNASAQPVFGNLLTLPIGGSGLLYVEPLYVEGRAENSFPLLRKVLVAYGTRVGYADTLSEALDQVFGAGAGQTATDGGQDSTGGGTSSPTTSPTTPAPKPTTPPAGGGGVASPGMEAAVANINSALDDLAAAQRSGDFEAQGKALAALQKAVDAYQAAQKSGAAAGPTG
jgi:hypothetical protein